MSRAARRPVMIALLAALLAGVPTASFAFVRSTLSATDATPLRWDLDETMLPLSNVQGGEIVWVFDLAGSSNLPGPEDSEAVQHAFDHWEGIGSSRVAFVRAADQDVQAANNDGINVVYWAEGSRTQIGGTNTNVTGFVSLTPVFSVASGANKGLIMDANIVLNGRQETWTVTPDTEPTAWDVEGTVTHEIGHFIGLDHSPVLGATMSPRFLAGEARMRILTGDDIRGASTIYPDGNFSIAGSVQGSVGRPAGVFGALVAVQDSDGVIVEESITSSSGAYAASGLPDGDYEIYVEPIDKSPAATTNLFDETDLGGIYDGTVDPNFFASLPLPLSVSGSSPVLQSFLVGSTAPTINISKIAGSVSQQTLVFRTAPTSVVVGTPNFLIGVAGPNLDPSVVVDLTGPGITNNGVFSTGSVDGEPSVVYSFSFAPSAPLGLRSIRVSAGTLGRTYASGSVSLIPNIPLTIATPGLYAVPPGEVNSGRLPGQEPITVALRGNDIDLQWQEEPAAYGYNIYRGTLASLHSGSYDHTQIPGSVNGQCGVTTAYSVLKGEALDPTPTYYLVTAFNNAGEGIIGRNSSNQLRPGPVTACPSP